MRGVLSSKRFVIILFCSPLSHMFENDRAFIINMPFCDPLSLSLTRHRHASEQHDATFFENLDKISNLSLSLTRKSR
jgi:hypothetical protein